MTLAAYQRAFTVVYQASAGELGFAGAGGPVTTNADGVRRALDELSQQGGASVVRIDDWERLVDLYGTATRDRTAGDLIRDLTSDLDQITQAMNHCSAASTLRRLTVLSAPISGLMVLAVVKQDRRAEFRRWAATARMAAYEAGDSTTTAWVLGQEGVRPLLLQARH